jgi:phage-related protein
MSISAARRSSDRRQRLAAHASALSQHLSNRSLAQMYPFRYIQIMKPIIFLGDSRDRLREFPADGRARAGLELREVQKGHEPTDWKPMKAVGIGVREVRIRLSSGAFRVIYLAALPDCVVVLHAFEKKTQQTSQKEIELAAQRLRNWRI